MIWENDQILKLNSWTSSFFVAAMIFFNLHIKHKEKKELPPYFFGTMQKIKNEISPTPLPYGFGWVCSPLPFQKRCFVPEIIWISLYKMLEYGKKYHMSKFKSDLTVHLLTTQYP